MSFYAKLSRQVFLNYVSYALVFLLGPLQIFLLTRFMSQKEYGIFSLFSAAIFFLVPLLDVGHSYYLLTKLSTFGRKRTNVLHSLFLFRTVFLLIAGIILFFCKDIFLKFADYSGGSQYLIFIGIVYIASMVHLLFSYVRSKRELEFSSVLYFMKESLWAVFVVIYFLIFRKIDIGIVLSLWLCSIIITLITEMVYVRKELFSKLKFKLELIKNASLFGLPLVPFLIGSLIMTFGDRYVINYYLGPEKVAIYSLAVSMVSIGLSLGTIVQSSLYPHLSHIHNKGKKNILFELSIKYSLLIVVPYVIGLLAMSGALVTMVSGVAYIPSVSVIPWLFLFPVFGIIIQIILQKLMLEDKTAKVGFVYLSGGILNLILNFLIIPYYGIIGAAMTTLVSYVYMLIMTVIFCSSLKMDYNIIKPVRIFLAAIIMGVIVWLINPQSFWIKILTIVTGVISYAILILVFRIFSSEEINIFKKYLNHLRTFSSQ